MYFESPPGANLIIYMSDPCPNASMQSLRSENIAEASNSNLYILAVIQATTHRLCS